MITEDFALPTGSEAEQLLAGLARLIQLRGAETFLSAPLLLAEPRYFPDAVTPRAEGVAVLLRRLLAYAGLVPERLIIEIYSGSRVAASVDDDVDPNDHEQAAAWFMDVDDGVYRFGVRETELRDERALIGTLGHEVAHAYRAHHRLVVPTRDIEEQLTDLTTIYLGFGVFTLESSYQFKTGHYDAQGQQLLYERQGRGYLRPGQLAFLLGAHLAARGAREDLLDEALSSLSENHGVAVRRAVEEQRAHEAELIESLGLPPVTEWPAPRALEDALEPLPETAVVLRDHAKAHKDRFEAEKIGFRVDGTRATLGVCLGLALGLAVVVVADLSSWFWPILIGSGGLGAWLGRRSRVPACSGCGHSVGVDAVRCHFCELALVGDIQTKLDLFDAEERYRAAEARSLDEARERASATAERRCPACQWAPIASDTWECSCGCRWHTFDTAGRCPDCDEVWETTWCPQCDETSPHADWYRGAS